ncbi:MAG TPA: Fe-S cluster assembly protein SufD [Thermoanaerobaculia bacterium]
MSMVETTPMIVRWESLLRAVMRERSGEPVPVRAMREAAFARFAEAGFPTTSQEEWRLTPVHPIATSEWEIAGPGAVSDQALAPWRIPGADAELVFVDGRFDAARSSLPNTKGVAFRALAAALSSPNGEIGALGRLAQNELRPFVALNTALMADGAVLEIEDGASAGLIHLLFHSSGGSRVVSPRVLVRAGRGVQATIVESHTGDGRYFTNAVTEVFGGEGAVIEHYKIVSEGAEGYHVGAIEMHQERDSTIHSRLIGLGGPLTRTDLATSLDGEGASCTLDGLYLLDGKEHFDAHTRIEHAKPHTDSLELYKGVLAGSARGVFNGLVIVRPDAQKITARQTNKNLLLSNDAIADSNPQLEIHANDVKCNHGSTIGQLDPTSLFYLRSRGIGLEQAKAMLTWAFAEEVIGRMKVEPVRKRLEEALLVRIGDGSGRAS